jgi:hypothetical protein
VILQKLIAVGYALKSQLQEVGKLWVHLRLSAIVCILLDCYCLLRLGAGHNWQIQFCANFVEI